jgi:hypothetical protein
MSEPSSIDDELGPLAESFLARFRKGERPSLHEYTQRHPHLAAQIREVSPALVELENYGPVATGPGLDRSSIVDRAVSSAGNASLAVPERLGDYRILRRVGTGGIGVVYEAVRESLRSHVVLKVMHPRYRTDRHYLRRFHIEPRAAAGLHHTNIVSVFDFGEEDGVCFYAMQFIQGQGLDRVLADLRRLRSKKP